MVWADWGWALPEITLGTGMELGSRSPACSVGSPRASPGAVLGRWDPAHSGRG